ncbi:MAG: hypothetical protein CK546_02915 [Pedosphaera sp.]|nr:MAG: hypothetical protein CK546_02915 [Pedosphaera sp.]
MLPEPQSVQKANSYRFLKGWFPEPTTTTVINLAHQLKRRTPGLSYRGFTLIELLVVIAINRGFAENHSASAPR